MEHIGAFFAGLALFFVGVPCTLLATSWCWDQGMAGDWRSVFWFPPYVICALSFVAALLLSGALMVYGVSGR